MVYAERARFGHDERNSLPNRLSTFRGNGSPLSRCNRGSDRTTDKSATAVPLTRKDVNSMPASGVKSDRWGFSDTSSVSSGRPRSGDRVDEPLLRPACFP